MFMFFVIIHHQTGHFWRFYSEFKIEFEFRLAQPSEENVELLSFSRVTANKTGGGYWFIRESLACFYDWEKCNYWGYRAPAIHLGN